MAADDPALVRVLERARRLGFLGPGPIEPQIDHACGFAAQGLGLPTRVLDLGSGGGVPGLVLARRCWTDAAFLLVDARRQRTEFLTEAVRELGLDARVAVLQARAEALGRQHAQRSRYDVVVARSFAAPSVTAECAAPFLQRGGALVVSEPPGPSTGRWPAAGLALLGLELASRSTGPPAFAVLRQRDPCPERFPRRVGVPARRPLFC